MNIQEKLKFLADDYGYSMLWDKPDNKLVRFEKGIFWVDVWYTTMTVAVHKETKGRWKRDVKYIKGVTMDSLSNIFDETETYI